MKKEDIEAKVIEAAVSVRTSIELNKDSKKEDNDHLKKESE